MSFSPAHRLPAVRSANNRASRGSGWSALTAAILGMAAFSGACESSSVRATDADGRPDMRGDMSPRTGTTPSDSQLSAQVKQAVGGDSRLGGSSVSVSVSVHNGVATLSGHVKTEGQKQSAGATAAGIAGVTSVDNQLMVTGGGVDD